MDDRSRAPLPVVDTIKGWADWSATGLKAKKANVRPLFKRVCTIKTCLSMKLHSWDNLCLIAVTKKMLVWLQVLSTGFWLRSGFQLKNMHFTLDTLPSARSHMAGLVALQLAGCARSFGMLWRQVKGWPSWQTSGSGLWSMEDSTTSMSLRLQTFFVYGIWTKGQATWNSIGGTPVATRRKWMCDTGWNEAGPWHWAHEFHVDLCKHLLRDGWRLWCWDQVLHTSRKCVVCTILKLKTSKDLLSLDWNLIRQVADTSAGCRTVSVGASVSPAWRQETCPFCKGTLGSWQHLAWYCNASPVANLRPQMPAKAIPWKSWDT